MRITAFALLCLSACGADCDLVEWNGVYLMTSVGLSGDCGPQTSTLSKFDNGEQSLKPGCRLNSPDDVSMAECKKTRAVTCDLTTDDMTVDSLWVLEQEDEAGEALTGTLTMTVRRLSDSGYICAGTYAISAKRQ